MEKKALVIGGAGFLGNQIASTLVAAGISTTVFDRNIPVEAVPDVTYIEGDILDIGGLNSAVANVDYVYHLGAVADLEEAQADPVRAVTVNILGTTNVLEAAVKANISRLLFASSIYVYSSSGGIYRITKQASEGLIEEYQTLFGLEYSILRFGSVYGPGAGRTNGINRLIHSALSGDHVTYQGDPEAMREYIHVDDAARLSVAILAKEYANKHLLLTGDEKMSVFDVMNMISEMLPHKPEPRIGEYKLAAHYKRTPYSFVPRKAMKITPNPSVDFGQGLLECIEQASDESF